MAECPILYLTTLDRKGRRFPSSSLALTLSNISHYCFTSRSGGSMSPQLPSHVESLAQAIIITCVVGPVLSAIIVGIRVWTRLYVTRNIGWDDYASLITLPFCIGFSVVIGISTRYGMGLHLRDVRTSRRSFLAVHVRRSIVP